jgi:hypothetical protein
VIFVFDLRLGERCAAVDAPVHRLFALVDQLLLDEAAERPSDRRLIPEVHRQVGVVPRAQHPETLELLRHCADEPLRVRTTCAAEIGDRHLALLRTELAVDLQLDGQAMAVVADDVGGVKPGHGPGFDDEILKNFVQGRPDVDVAVGVGRAVMEDELGRPCPAGPNLRVQADCGPPGERFRLGYRQVRLHREVGSRQVQGVFPLRHGYPLIL